MNYVVGIIEIVLYLLYVTYSIYLPAISHINKKKLGAKHKVIKNPMTIFESIGSRAVLILSLPSIILMFTILDETIQSEVVGIYIYFAIFLTLIFIGYKALSKSRGDYYINENGIHFLQNSSLDISFYDIEKSIWLDYSNIHEAETTVKLTVRGKKITLYNMKKDYYIQYISKENIMEPKHEAVISIYKKFFSKLVNIISLLCFFTFMIFIIYPSQYGNGGGAMTETEEYSYEQLAENQSIPHYLINHGELTEVSYHVWKNALVLERLVIVLWPLLFLCCFINAIWERNIQRKRYK